MFSGRENGHQPGADFDEIMPVLRPLPASYGFKSIVPAFIFSRSAAWFAFVEGKTACIWLEDSLIWPVKLLFRLVCCTSGRANAAV